MLRGVVLGGCHGRYIWKRLANANARYNKCLEEKRTEEARMKTKESDLRKQWLAELQNIRREEERATELAQSLAKRRKQLENSDIWRSALTLWTKLWHVYRFLKEHSYIFYFVCNFFSDLNKKNLLSLFPF